MLTKEDFKAFTSGFFDDAATGPAVSAEELERLSDQFAHMVYDVLPIPARLSSQPEEK